MSWTVSSIAADEEPWKAIPVVSDPDYQWKLLTIEEMEMLAYRASQDLPRPPTPPPTIRTRNVFFLGASGEVVAGLIQRGFFRAATVYRWLGIVLEVDEEWFLRSVDTRATVSRADCSLLATGSYEIVNAGGFPIAGN